MEALIWWIPVALTAFVLIKQVLRTWKEGLFMAILYLLWTAVAAVAGFALTRLLLDPAKGDLFGLGALLVEKIPQDFFRVMPQLQAFIQALPMALAAVILFPVFFDIIRVAGNNFLRKQNKKQGWSERFLTFPGQRLLAGVLALATACICLMTDLVILVGALPFCGNMLYCAETVTGQAAFRTAGDAVHGLEEHPVVQVANRLGATELFYELTSAKRGEEAFSVGQEMNELSHAFVGLLPIFEAVPQEGSVPDGQQLRALPQALAESPGSMELVVALVSAYRQELGDSDAILIVSTLMDVTPEQFESYLATLDTESAQADMTTVCNIVALLADRGLLVEAGEAFDLSSLSDPELRAEVKQELLKNPNMVAFFGLES